MYENQKINDTLDVALGRAKAMVGNVGLVGYGVATLTDAQGRVKQCEPFTNLVTTAGDKWYAQAAAAAAGGSAASPTAPTGMKLGTDGTNAATKSGTYAALGTYISGSNELFDSTVSAAPKGGDTGWEVTYVTIWEPANVTNATILEVVIVNDAGTDATSTAANTYSRAIISNVNKASGDTLTVTWKHLFLGA